MPAGPTEPVPPPGPPQGFPPEEPPRPSPAEAPPDPPGPLRDVDLIFRTIEQLTLKLNRLKAVEAAHRELLRSLGHSSSADTTPVGVPAHGTEGGWAQRPHSPEGDSPLTRSLRSHSANVPGCRAPLAEDPAHTA
ncbi:rho guanine nucleotide exchange factor 11-like, partial [Numida meleagris]|uniref:rho guanine nucleotide exchange factor 11-like n=1 Tax=Numida meleagris TaxID=8996 RepID=UPI000B3DB0B3